MKTPARGGMHKTTTQAIGTLSTTWVNITGYTANIYSASKKMASDLVNGTLRLEARGDYSITINLEVECVASGTGTARKMMIRLFDTTSGVAVPNTEFLIYVSGHATGASISSSIPLTVGTSLINKNLRLQIQGLSSFSSVNVLGALFWANAIDSNA